MPARGQPGADRRDRRGQGKVGEGRLRDAAPPGRAGDPARRAGGRGAEAADAGRARAFRGLRPPVPGGLRGAGAAATAVAARGKLDEGAFRRLHRGILAAGPECPSWKGRRILAVDGSKVTLPREPAARGYRVADGAHHPRGMVSALYRLRDRIPVDFDLSAHGNGREVALTHLDRAAEGDVIVYDRGYRSFAMAIAHHERGLDFVFRIQGNANPAFDAFIASGGTELTVTLDAPRDGTAPRGRNLRLRLVKYVAGDTEYCLATSLTDGGRSAHGRCPTSITAAGASRRRPEAGRP